MFTAHDLKLILWEAYHFAHSLGRVHDMFLCIEEGQTLEQVGEKPVIYLRVSKYMNKNEIIAGFRNYFKESPELILLLGAAGDSFECPKCSRKLSDFLFRTHLEEHRFTLVTVNYSTCANSLEKKILRTTQKDVPSSKQTDMLEQLLDSSTIKSLYHSATIGEYTAISASAFRKFLIFEEEVNHRKNLTQGESSAVLSRAEEIQSSIRGAVYAKRIIVNKKKRQKRGKKKGMQIFSGGIPGLGKNS